MIPAVIPAGIPVVIMASGAGYVKPKLILLSVIPAVITAVGVQYSLVFIFFLHYHCFW